ncbi:MAG TPA: hypothetical protein VHV82_02530 [Sporichthyaceae bacterium]|jgi:hypothetical protein|nr:hypothetical protein [Sporichthyaceae bacterium]
MAPAHREWGIFVAPSIRLRPQEPGPIGARVLERLAALPLVGNCGHLRDWEPAYVWHGAPGQLICAACLKSAGEAFVLAHTRHANDPTFAPEAFLCPGHRSQTLAFRSFVGVACTDADVGLVAPLCGACWESDEYSAEQALLNATDTDCDPCRAEILELTA